MTEVMLIDQQVHRCEAMATVLREQGLSTTTHTALPSIGNLAQSKHRCVIVEAHLVEAHLVEVSALVPVIVITENANVADAVRTIQSGAANYLALPVDSDTLIAAVERAVTQSSQEEHSSLDHFALIGSSTCMRTLKEGIEKVAPTESTVLIQGQSGTGKELVARAIHAASQRAHAPLISINCAAVPENLIETELFGREQLDSASSSHPGLVDAANGGTLFLDEIAELPSAAQARLLRVLQGEHRRIGSSETKQIDVRIIAATHRNLNDLVEGNQFRQDLYYRLNVVCFQLAPLRQRESDALEIADWMLKRTSLRLNKGGLDFAPEAREAMQLYHWPGNVRELENAIERAVILSDGGTLISKSLLAIEPAPDGVELPEQANASETSLEDYFVRFVLDNQDQCTETELAEKLGISRKSLWERRQRLNIPRRKTKKRGPRRDSVTDAAN